MMIWGLKWEKGCQRQEKNLDPSLAAISVNVFPEMQNCEGFCSNEIELFIRKMEFRRGRSFLEFFKEI